MIHGYCPECGKIQFTSKKEAIKQTRLFRRRHTRTSKRKLSAPKYPYVCQFCGLWHLSSQAPKK